MTLPRIFLLISLVLFGAIGVAAIVKRKGTDNKVFDTNSSKTSVEPSRADSLTQNDHQVIEIDLAALHSGANFGSTSNVVAATSSSNSETVAPMATDKLQPITQTQQAAPTAQEKIPQAVEIKETLQESDIPNVDRINLLFQKDSPLPIVQTIAYKSKVSWKTGRSAWLVDYAAHYKTHLHFIARSMNGKVDYNPRPASEGQTFNVLTKNVNFNFHLVIDLSRCKMMLFAIMPDLNERVLLKTYRVGLGRLDSSKASGSLTPLGKYSLGSRIAVYQPKMMGTYRGKRTEMITVFGTRWIPFENEIANCSEPAKGYGIHGTPWHIQDGRLVDNTASIGKYESDGCIRMRASDVEELFAIVSTHQTIIEIVSDFSKVTLPGKDKMY